jgi:hypothetical protein
MFIVMKKGPFSLCLCVSAVKPPAFPAQQWNKPIREISRL